MAINVANNPSFGGILNNLVATLFVVNAAVARLNAAVGEAATGFTGTAGTEYEGPTSLFGVTPGTNPGDQGQAFASAMVTINNAWDTFWSSASGAINALDSGQRGPQI